MVRMHQRAPQDVWHRGVYLVSDRAKALVKLAQTGLDCLSIPDLFHLSHDLAKGYALSICGRLRQAQQGLGKPAAPGGVAGLPARERPGAAGTGLSRGLRGRRGTLASVRSASRQHLANLSRIVHPWRLVDATRQTSPEVERQLHGEIQGLETLLATHGLPVKKDTLDKVRKQLAGVSALIDFWWQTVWHALEHMAMTPRWTQWIEELLLPLMYWQEQLSRTRCPVHKAQIARALQAMQDAFARHPCTGQLAPEVLAGWQAWAGEHARAFQRASSAVEGRNGYLSQMQHNHRGLPARRSQVWTALHNFDCYALDGTTPALRFFRREFPDLFESVLSQIDELPLSRQRHQALAVSD